MWFAQISDLHITREGGTTHYSGDTAPSLARCIDDILRVYPRPAAVVASGDLVNEGSAAEYVRLISLLGRLDVPVYVIPGNHDRREALRIAFADRGYLPLSGPLHYVVKCGDVLIVALDTLVEGEEGGRLDDAQLAWLAATLAASDPAPAVIVMHHPPMPTGIPSMDEIALDTRSAEKLGCIVERNANVKRIVCGHVHRDLHADWRGKTVSVCPSTAFQTSLRFVAASFIGDFSQPAAYFAHHWDGQNLATHTVNVPGGVIR
ncbi:MAG: phosphodiesterase [Rhodospirillaceae bacterium]